VDVEISPEPAADEERRALLTALEELEDEASRAGHSRWREAAVREATGGAATPEAPAAWPHDRDRSA
jgi:hypothetical protein